MLVVISGLSFYGAKPFVNIPLRKMTPIDCEDFFNDIRKVFVLLTRKVEDIYEVLITHYENCVMKQEYHKSPFTI